MENINIIKKKLEEEASLKGKILPKVKKTYDRFKENNIKEVFDDNSISDVEYFFIYELKMKDLVIQGTKDKGIAVHANDKRIELNPGNKINTLEELNALLKSIKNYYNQTNNKKEINFIEITKDEKEYYKNIVNDFNTKNAKYIYDLFIKLYEEKENTIKKIQNFITLVDEYISNPNYAKYVYLMNNRPFMNNEDVRILKNELGKFLTQEKHETQKLVSIYDNDKTKVNDYKFVDDEMVTLSLNAQGVLDDIYSFVRELDKEGLKEFASDPLSYFSYIDDEKENIIHNFAVLLNKDDTISYNKTIIKRLGFKIRG